MKKVISLLLCIVLVSGCGKQPAVELAPINVLPSAPTIDNKVLLDPKNFPATNVTHNHYTLIEFNGDKLAELWSKTPQKVKYAIYGVSAFIVLLLSAHGVFSFLARLGILKDHSAVTSIKVDTSGSTLKGEVSLQAGSSVSIDPSNNSVAIDQNNGHNLVVTTRSSRPASSVPSSDSPPSG
ncbi:hypothetical protein [Candidatus Endomicrobiellum agilis]|uniref:hypothetical protein n=1 Tax=Candidatus Endomicrobiellum agilis TaxID=3238957 RepID=UPI003587BB2B|nr:hypothetical protein [Endomicrobium sp.]